MTQEKGCAVCGKLFTPSKYRPTQAVCSSPECQRQRQIKNIKQWRLKYKEKEGPVEKEAAKQRCREWRRRHHEYLKLYRESHREESRNYMRTYMQGYRRKKKGITQL